jgi:hypothetical protein
MKKPPLMRLGVFVAIIAILATVLPLPSLVARASVGDWQKGVSIDSKSSGDFASESFRTSVKNAKAMGTTHISLVIPYYQANKTSSDIFNGATTPSDETLINAIDYIHSQGLKVILKPHLEIVGGEWRGLIQADNRDAWYTNYGKIINHLADIGKAHSVEEFIIGSELIGMASSYRDYNNTERWEKIIADVRARYSGLVTYSANWGNGENYVNEFEYIKFWGKLDYIGISGYFEHWNDGSVPSLVDSWRSTDENQIRKLQRLYDKPVLFTEIGYRSVDNAHQQPWNSGMPGNYNADEQVRDYTALFQYWNTQDYFKGIVIWNWDSNPDYGGQGNTDYTPHNKPAEVLIRDWFTGNPGGGQTPPQTPAPTGSWDSSASGPSTVQPNNTVNFNIEVRNSGEAQGIITDIEIYDPGNNRVYQQFFENQTITSANPKQYSMTFTPSTNGTYRIKIGTFNNSWNTNYYWNDNLFSFTVGSVPQNPPTTNPPPSSSTRETDIWWPGDSVTVSGLQPFKALVRDLPTSEYRMYWQVDGDQLNEMQNNDTDYPHKEVLVDLSGWNWKNEGPYNINFVSKDLAGNTISQKSVNIYITR